MTGILSAQELAAKLAKARSEKASAAAKAHAAEEEAQKALLEKLSHPSGLSADAILEKAAILVDRAVESGQTSILVFRFPHALCTDKGRAISQVEAGWEKTLVGLPKEIYELWGRQLKPKGYHIRFEIIDYPGGMPGDIGITLSWATAQADKK
jgi:hypothetical protein